MEQSKTPIIAIHYYDHRNKNRVVYVPQQTGGLISRVPGISRNDGTRSRCMYPDDKAMWLENESWLNLIVVEKIYRRGRLVRSERIDRYKPHLVSLLVVTERFTQLVDVANKRDGKQDCNLHQAIADATSLLHNHLGDLGQYPRFVHFLDIAKTALSRAQIIARKQDNQQPASEVVNELNMLNHLYELMEGMVLDAAQPYMDYFPSPLAYLISR